MGECAVQFEPWPSIARLNRQAIITEKLDGTNAAIVIGENGEFACQSRKRLITPQDDNHGFARWAYERADELTMFLGPGRHFGEWWGKGINRGYGLDEKRFSLFNVMRWVPTEAVDVEETGPWPAGLSVVPVLYTGPFNTGVVSLVMGSLKQGGSVAAPGFKNPEGI